MAKDTKRKLIEIAVGGLLYGFAIFAAKRWELGQYQSLALFLAAYTAMTIDTLWTLGKDFLRLKFFDENFLMVLATIGAFLVGKNLEAVGVMLVFHVGKLLESISLNRSKQYMKEFMDIRPDHANRKVKGKEVLVDPNELKLRHIIIIKPGERVPVDCVVTSGMSTIDTMALTGEAEPVNVEVGNRLYSGSINITGVLEARVTKQYEDSTASKILKLVENANNRKGASQTFLEKFTKVYTPLVTFLAFALMIIPPLTFAQGNVHTWVYRGLVFLVTASPCGLMISVPLAFFGAIGAASRQGVLIKSSNCLEDLTKAETFVFDKTGTLTQGVFQVQEICPEQLTEEELLEITAHGEAYSNHPIAMSLREAYGKTVNKKKVTWIKEFSGFGVRANIDGKRVFIGNSRFMAQQGFYYKRVSAAGTAVHVAIDGEYAGYILIADSLRDDAKYTIKKLKRYQMVLVMLTGDNLRVANAVSGELGMDFVYANLLPEQKVELLEEFMESKMEEEKLVFVGDGINDAPVLARADIGIAMGGLGADAAIEAADIVLMEDEPSKIINAFRIAKETVRVVKQNIMFAIGIKVILLTLAAVGLVTMRTAIVADMAVLIINLLNAFWVMQYPE